MWVLYLSLFSLFVALLLFISSFRLKRRSGLPAGKVVYSDTSRWGKVEKPLYDPALRLSGKPDYLVKQGRQIIPIEVKARSAPRMPYDGHIYQLAAYCLLVTREFSCRPHQGLIHYTDRTFAVDFSPALEASTLAIIHEMQEQTEGSQVDRSHDNPRLCQSCSYRFICDQSLRI